MYKKIFFRKKNEYQILGEDEKDENSDKPIADSTEIEKHECYLKSTQDKDKGNPQTSKKDLLISLDKCLSANEKTITSLKEMQNNLEKIGLDIKQIKNVTHDNQR